MAIMPKIKAGQLVEAMIAGEKHLGLVLGSSQATRRGQSPMIKVEWAGDPPRDYRIEYVEERLLKIVK